jgi:hypothetical protein
LFLKEKLLYFSFEMGKHKTSIDRLVSERIRERGLGWVFTPSAFGDLGSRTAVDLALFRQKSNGVIRQLSRGLYDYPKIDPQLGTLSPSSDAIAEALKGHSAIRLQPSGAYAANLLGLSEQVPMKLVFLTDGPSRIVRVGNQLIVLRRTTPRNMATAGRISGLVIQALRHLGQDQINDTVVDRLSKRLSKDDKKQLLHDMKYAPIWMAPVMHKVITAS